MTTTQHLLVAIVGAVGVWLVISDGLLARLWGLGPLTMLHHAYDPDAPFPELVSLNSSDLTESLATVLQRYQAAGQPLVIRNAASHWPAAQLWSDPHYLAANFGPGHKVVLQTSVSEQEEAAFVISTIKAFADWISSHRTLDAAKAYNARYNASSSFYWAEEFGVLQSYPGLIQDMRMSELTQSARGRSENAFWMGGPAAKTGWHYDYDYSFNALVHLVGRKTMVLAPPSQSARLYPSSKLDPGAVLSAVDLWEPDLDRFPEYSKLRSIQLEIEPGDVVLVPMGWWHAVYAHDFVVSVSWRQMGFVEDVINSLDRVKETLHQKGWFRQIGDCLCHAKGLKLRSLLDRGSGVVVQKVGADGDLPDELDHESDDD